MCEGEREGGGGQGGLVDRGPCSSLKPQSAYEVTCRSTVQYLVISEEVAVQSSTVVADDDDD